MLALLAFADPSAFAAPRTFCNPMSLPDMPVGLECRKFRDGDLIVREKLPGWAWQFWPGPKEGPKYAHQFRELADPEIHVWNGAWYLYPSCGMLWKSVDGGANWQHLKVEGYDPHYAPTVERFRGKYYLTESGSTRLWVADSPEGPFRVVGKLDYSSFGSPEDPEINFGDPMLFADGDHLYVYCGCVAKQKCLWGTELDPENPRRALRPMKRLVWFDSEKRPWMWGPLEGAYVFKRGDTYYFTHAGNSPATKAYATSVWKGPTPLGPFVPQAKNPFFSRGSGCARGGGHGGIFQDAAGDWWTCYTIWPGAKFHGFERHIGLDRIAFDANGDIVSAEPTDEPQWAPSSGRKGPAGWKKLPMTTTAKGAADDSLRTYEKFPSKPGAMTFEFDGVKTLYAIRVIWCDFGLDELNGVVRGPWQYRVERRLNGEWHPWVDASENRVDLNVDYRETAVESADAVRITVLDGPKGITPALTEFTVFGVPKEDR